MHSVVQEYIEQGKQQGRQSRNIEIAKKMLLNFRSDLDFVQKVTDLPKNELKQILAGTK